MKVPTLISEAFANLRAHFMLSVAVAIVAFTCSAATIFISTFEITGIVERQDELVARGANVWVVTGSAGLSARRCDDANRIIGVANAGAMMRSTFLRAATPNERHIRIIEGTPRLVAIFWPSLDSGTTGRIVGNRVAADYGLTEKAFFSTRSGMEPRTFSVSVADASKRSPTYDSVIVETAPARGTVLECLVEGQPGHKTGVEAALLSWFSSEQPTITPYFSVPETGRSPQAEVEQRLSAWAAVAAAVVIALSTIAIWRVRRLDFALYALLGVRHQKILIMLITECAAIAIFPSCLGLLISLVTVGSSLTDPFAITALITDVSRILLLVVVTPILGYFVLRPKSALERIRGR
jgi:hypothetical protein